MAKDKGFLKGIASRLSGGNPMAMILNLAKPFMGDFNAYIASMNLPESEGGQLKDGEQKCMLALDNSKGDIRIVQVFMKIENGQAVITRMVHISNLNEIEQENGQP